MAGFLLYGKDFRAEHYIGGDGKPHYEIRSVDGDFYSISNSSWDELTELCSAHGFPIAFWPVYETCLDVPIDEVRNMNRSLRDQILMLPVEVIQSLSWLRKIITRIKEGDFVVYCRM